MTHTVHPYAHRLGIIRDWKSRWFGVKSKYKELLRSDIIIRQFLEKRLDNIVYRLGIAQSRDQARQLVNHGHILVNGKKVSIPSYKVKTGDEIKIREGSKKSAFFNTLAPQWLAKYEAPAWVEIDKVKMIGKVKGRPTLEESGINPNDLQAIIEFYSR